MSKLIHPELSLAAFALHVTDDARSQALVEQFKVRLRRLDLELGLLANFYSTRLAITPVRVKSKTTTVRKGSP